MKQLVYVITINQYGEIDLFEESIEDIQEFLSYLPSYSPKYFTYSLKRAYNIIDNIQAIN